jgi:hypothetical protein
MTIRAEWRRRAEACERISSSFYSGNQVPSDGNSRLLEIEDSLQKALLDNNLEFQIAQKGFPPDVGVYLNPSTKEGVSEVAHLNAVINLVNDLKQSRLDGDWDNTTDSLIFHQNLCVSYETVINILQLRCTASVSKLDGEF